MSAQRRFVRTGTDWFSPPALSSMQRERAEGPFASEFRGRRGVLTWSLVFLVGAIFWTAFFALVLG